jgi:prepilin-type processing-associated H-X9-DG protein
LARNWPGRGDQPPTDLFAGNSGTSLGRICVARHPLNRVRVRSGEKLPGSINMSFADGHAGKIRLHDIKKQTWHVDYGPIADPGKTAPLGSTGSTARR